MSNPIKGSFLPDLASLRPRQAPRAAGHAVPPPLVGGHLGPGPPRAELWQTPFPAPTRGSAEAASGQVVRAQGRTRAMAGPDLTALAGGPSASWAGFGAVAGMRQGSLSVRAPEGIPGWGEGTCRSVTEEGPTVGCRGWGCLQRLSQAGAGLARQSVMHRVLGSCGQSASTGAWRLPEKPWAIVGHRQPLSAEGSQSPF